MKFLPMRDPLFVVQEEECPMAHRVELAANEYKKLINNSTNSTWLGVSIATRYPMKHSLA